VNGHTLKAEGIAHIFGIVGTHNCPLFDGVFDDPAFKVVTVRQVRQTAPTGPEADMDGPGCGRRKTNRPAQWRAESCAGGCYCL
jgi:hypothetical protein